MTPSNLSDTPNIDTVRTATTEHANRVHTGALSYLADRKLAARQLAMAMRDAIGGNKYRKFFLLTIYGVAKTSDLSDEAFAGLWHWCKPYTDPDTHHWHINREAYVPMLLVMREITLGIWINDEGAPAQMF